MSGLSAPIRMLRLAACAVLTAASLALQAPPGAASVDPISFHPTNLQVYGGEATWRTTNDFSLSWSNPVDPSNPYVSPVAAVHHRVRNMAGALVLGDTRIPGSQAWIDPFIVPNVPGRYTAEVWLEDASGFQGATATATLLFDNEPPAPVTLAPPPEWIGRNAIPYPVHIGGPATTPVSGIKGYAVSVDSSPDGDPCAAADRCTDVEVDLPGGPDDNTLPLPELAEGMSYVHAVAVSGSGMKSSATGTAILRVDRTLPATRLAGLPNGWSDRPVTLTATATDALSGMRPDGPSGPFTAIRVDGGVPRTASGDSVSATVIDEGVHEIAFYARDAAGNVNDDGDSNGLPNESPTIAVARIDREPPNVSFANSQDPREPELIRLRVTDSLSGPAASRGWIGVRRAGSGDRFESLASVFAAGGELRAHWDSDGYAAGRYEFRGIGHDAAGNNASTGLRADGAAMVLANPLKAPTAIQAGFGGRELLWHRCVERGGQRRCRAESVGGFNRRPSERFLPYGRGTLFSGRLVAGLRTPLPLTPVRIVERFDSGSSEAERVSIAWTDAEGFFQAHLPRGASREVTAAFGGTGTLSRSASRPVRLGVRSGVRLRVSSGAATIGGPPVVFRGSIAAGDGAIPPGGKAVQLQFRLPGLPWAEFRTVQTDAKGRFRYAYRFSDDDSSGVRFLFRAYVTAQGGWPYEPAGSRPVAVRGRSTGEPRAAS